MNVFLRVVAIMYIVVSGIWIGAHMHQQVQIHDAELRAPGELYNRNVKQKMDQCLRSAMDHDLCFIIMGITV